MESTNLVPSATPRMPSSLQALRRKLPIHHSKKARYILSCKATDGRVDRRDVLLRLGGTAAAGLSLHSGALAAPIESPDFSNCHHVHILKDIPNDIPNDIPKDINCCPPYIADTPITNFKLPPASSPLRVRPAAHLVDEEYLAKYEKAVEQMKQLPDDDPRSFSQQWHVHCAYCDGAYDQVGCRYSQIQIHGSWLFFPWHRLYLYFHERILGKLIDDETFALPFWNWDAPDGMTLPKIYINNMASPLYDEKRSPCHQPPSLVDLNYCGTDHCISRDEQIDQNLKSMYRQMISCAKKTELFLGQPYCAGSKPYPGAGSVEHVPHNTVHDWTGDPRMPNKEDMGILYSAARDPVFFAHHGNVDRMWHIWRNLSLSHTDFTDADWLDANFLFYDEEKRLVRVHVRDCLDTSALRYTYQDVRVPWLHARPTRAVGGTLERETGALGHAPLEKTVRVPVTRPRTSRTPKEKEEEEEVLIIEGIKIADHSKYVKLDVYVNEPQGGRVNPASAEFAGSVTLARHRTGDKKEDGTIETTARFGISDLLDEIKADGDKTIIVSLVPRSAGESVTVRCISIGYVK